VNATAEVNWISEG